MIYLIAAILASFTITLMIKDNEARGATTEVVLGANYVSASLLGWTFVLLSDISTTSRQTLLLGLVGGLLWPGAFFMLMWGIRHYGVSLAGSISRLSLTVPVLFAVLFLGERANLPTGLGVLGAFAAFLLLSPITLRMKRVTSGSLDRQALWYFPGLVLIFGVVDLWANLFTTTAPAVEKPVFLALIFTVAGGLMWSVVARDAARTHRMKVDRQSIVRGLVLGVPNFFSTFFLMESLKSPTFSGLSAVVYALYSVVGVILAYLAGTLIWKEPLQRRHRAGVAVAVIAIALLNLR